MITKSHGRRELLPMDLIGEAGRPRAVYTCSDIYSVVTLI
jgi:hypothetical protein